LVTEELSFGKGAGGIGGAFHELALTLRHAGNHVDIIFVPEFTETKAQKALTNYYDAHGIEVIDPAIDSFAWSPLSYDKRSYALYRYLVTIEEPYDFIHFHDYKGLGYFVLAGKTQGLGFANTRLIVQVHGPSRWALQANDHPFQHYEQLKIDYMERESIARADILISPSHYMLRWLKENKWKTPPDERVLVIQNICTHLAEMLGPIPTQKHPLPSDEIIFFGRHEERKGIELFCDALDLVRHLLFEDDVTVTFLGGFGVINGEASALYLARRARDWRFRIQLLPDYERTAAVRHLISNDRSVVVVPSHIENSPYSVLEAAISGKAVICSDTGGTSELLQPSLLSALTCPMSHCALAERLTKAVREGLPQARLAVPPAKTVQQWHDVHRLPVSGSKDRQPAANRAPRPRVTAVITHFERPHKLFDAIISLAAQTYPDLEVVVVDDGSRDPVTLQALDRMQPLFTKLNVRLLRQKNRYLGAARNLGIAETKSEYILFLDDDDIAFPSLVQTLVNVAQATKADIVNCIQLYMAESRRSEAYPFPEKFSEKVSFVPIGGPLAVAPFDNCYGGSTALVRRSAINRIGGYTEDYGIGHEDFELYVRALQEGLRIEVCPLPLVLYEVGRPSMLTTTSRLRNWNRIVRALDVSQQPIVWNDLISVTAGQGAMEHNKNYGEWWKANSPQSALLKQITWEPVDSSKYAALLQEYAGAIGAVSYANASRTLATTRSNEAMPSDTVLMPSLARRQPQNRLHTDVGSLMLGALIDLSVGRIDDAVSTFVLDSQRLDGAALCEPQLRFLRTLARHDGLSAQQASRTLEVLKQVSPDLDQLRHLIPIMFRLALQARDTACTIDLYERAEIVDEKLYLAHDANIAEQINSGTFTSPLDHYVYFGDLHDRASFSLLRELTRA
jgi:GT2 family glycosyltransferase/glycosyltransferase involved in cell wall biosynthesis